jgi:hypothetical protein
VDTLSLILDHLAKRSDCILLPSSGLPTLPSPCRCPPDLAWFYSQCGGAELFGSAHDRRYRIPSPSRFTQIGAAIYNAPMPDPRQHTWFTLADVQDGDYIAIDCHPARLGYCYDVFHETASELAHCRVLALSFTEFLTRAAECGDSAWWLEDDYQGYGFADSLPW